MSADPDDLPPRSSVECDARDLEMLVTLLELGAIYLTSKPGDRFTVDALFTEAKKIVPEVDERDLRIVLAHMKSIRRVPGGYELR